MNETLKIVIPMAGWGTRMRPHTWSKPKPLVPLAGKTALDYLLEPFQTLPDSFDVEYLFIVGPYLGETQIPPYIARHYPQFRARYPVQHEMKGQSHAIYLTREWLRGPMVMIFSDTLIDADFAFLAEEKSDIVAWVKPVPDPRRFGVAVTDSSGRVSRLVEKPDTMENNLAVVGCYYFREGEALISAIEEQIRRDVQLKNEYFLADAINIMLERGASMRVERVNQWLDAGTIDAALETNAVLLDRFAEETPPAFPNTTILPPVAIHPSALIENAVIGPHVSIGANCEIRDSRIEESILGEGTRVYAAAPPHSLVGANAEIRGRGAEEPPLSLNVGDSSRIRVGGEPPSAST